MTETPHVSDRPVGDATPERERWRAPETRAREREQPKNWWGIASLVVALGTGLLLAVTIGFLTYVEMSTPGGVDEDSGVAIAGGLVMFLAVGGELLAMALGVVGLVVANRGRVLAAVGLTISIVAILVFVALLVIGLAAG